MMAARARVSRPALGLLIGGVLGASALVGWRCYCDPAIPFLTARPPADWILYPQPWILTARQVKQRQVVFRTAFDLVVVPHSAPLELRVFRGYTLRINGKPIHHVADLGASWKKVQHHDVATALRPGRNEIEVDVTHISGPPALWLVLRAGGGIIKSDASWLARTEEKPWAPVRLATEPMRHPISETSPSVGEGWRTDWTLVVVWIAIAAAVLLVAGVLRRRWNISLTPLRVGGDESVRWRRIEWVVLGAAVVAWAALCANNLYRLPPVVGFDSPAHLDYVHYVQKRHRLPLANEGWEMYQPPLYYVISACLVSVGKWADWSEAGTAPPKLVSMISGLGLVLAVWWIVRLMFPTARRARLAGMILAVAMPMNLYMSQYPSNEVMSAALVAAAIAMTLQIVRRDTASYTRYAVLGVVLGLAMLAKHTALLGLIVVLGVLLVHDFRGGMRPGLHHLTRLGTALVMVLLVSGWFAYRNWVHFRNPLVGNWDPESGNAWWQDPGVGTSAYYLRFGRSITMPFHSCLYSFADGIYSTVWGDGMCSGIAEGKFRTPWHYHLLAIGYSLSWLPTALILIGLVGALVAWVRRPSATWGLLGAHGLLVGFAVFYMTLRLPYYAQAKGFYGLTAMGCICSLGALGFDLTSRWLGRARVALWTAMLVWAINAYASHFVWPVGAQVNSALGAVFAFQGKPERAVAHFRRALEEDPNHIQAYRYLGELLSNLRRYSEAGQTWRDGLTRDPENVAIMNELAWLLATCPDASVRDGPTALSLAERAHRLARSDHPKLLEAIAAAQAETGRFGEAVRTQEGAIRSAQSRGRTENLSEMRDRLARYEARRPYHHSGP